MSLLLIVQRYFQQSSVETAIKSPFKARAMYDHLEEIHHFS